MLLTDPWEEMTLKTLEEQRQKNRRKQAAALGGWRAFETYTLEALIRTPHNKAALEAVLSFDPERENLYFRGPTGTGKSHLAAIAARKHLDVETITPMRLSREIRAADGAREEAAIIHHYQSLRVLVLDDLGLSRQTEFLVTILYELVNWRYMNNVNGLIVTSNLSIGDLAEKLGDDRISSRLAQMCKMLSLVGEKDWRLEKPEAR